MAGSGEWSRTGRSESDEQSPNLVFPEASVDARRSLNIAADEFVRAIDRPAKEPEGAWEQHRLARRSLRQAARQLAAEEATGQNVEVACADQGRAGARAEAPAAAHGIRPEAVRPPQARRGFALPPRRWVAERSSAWAPRRRRLVRDRLPETVAGLPVAASACLIPEHAADPVQVPDSL